MYEEQGLSNARVSLCPFVCLSRRSTAAVACGGFAAERRVGRTYRSVAAGGGAQQESRSTANAGSVMLTADGETEKL